MKNKILSALLAAALAVPALAVASSHREAPNITKMPKVDSTDFYMFKSYETGRGAFVTLIADYQPFQDAFGGPNYFTMDPEALYEIHIDNNGDAAEDLTFQFRFQNALAGGTGAALTVGGKSVAVPLRHIGPITAADMSKQNELETYSVKMVRGNRRTGTAADVTNSAGGGTVFKKPFDFTGTKTFTSAAAYKTYADTFIYDVKLPGCPAGTPDSRMFVGQRKEPFNVNIGPIFDLVNAPAAVITNNTLRDAVGKADGSGNPLAKKNITTIALEVPIACLKAGTQDVLGGWQTASVRQARAMNPKATYAKPERDGGAWTQVSRLGMPLVNEVVIGLKDKDRFNSSEPKDDGQFADYVTNPTMPAIIEVLFPTVKAPTKFPRADLVAVFLTGVPSVNLNGATAEYQRLNTALPATPKATQNNLGAAGCFVNGVLTLTNNPACDPAGFPNGRRPGDDVVDIELRALIGYLYTNDVDAPSRNIPLHDAVLQDATQFDEVFPYLRTPNQGANGDGT